MSVIRYSYEVTGEISFDAHDIVSAFDYVEVDGGKGITDDDIMEEVFQLLEGHPQLPSQFSVENRDEIIAAVRQGFRSAAEWAAQEVDESGEGGES